MNHHDRPKGRGAGYIRVSDGDKQDPERQRQDILRWAAKLGIIIVAWYEDVEGRNCRDASESREAFQRLLKDVEAGKWDFVAVQSQDRWGTKDAYEYGYYAHILRMNSCELWSTTQGCLTLDDNATPIITSVNAGASRQEMLEKGQRNVSGKRIRAANGEWQGGYVPYGYDVVCLDPTGKEKWRVVILRMIPRKGVWERVRIYPDGKEERFDGDGNFPAKEKTDKLFLAPSVIKERIENSHEIFRLYATGAWTLRGLCKSLNQQKIDPVIGEGWNISRLATMLRNPVYYAGQTVWGKQSHGKYAQYVNGEYVIPERYKGKVRMGRRNAVRDWIFPKHTEAVLEKELFDEVQKKLVNDNPRKQGLRNADLYLAGMVYCGRCGVRMMGAMYKGEPTYICYTYSNYAGENKSGCRLHRTPQALIEKYVGTYLEDIKPEIKLLLDNINTPHNARQVNQLRDLHKEQVEAVDAMVAKVYTYPVYQMTESIYLDQPDSTQTLRTRYLEWLTSNRPQLEKQIADKKTEMADLTEKFALLPRSARTALEIASKKIDSIQREIDALERQLEPLTERLEDIYREIQELESYVLAAGKATTAREKAEVLRKIFARIVLHFRHWEQVPSDKRSKRKSVPKSELAKIEFVPWVGEPAVICAIPADA